MSQFMEVIEWLDDTGREIVHRFPAEGSGEIKLGAQLIVRVSQAAVFFRDGRGLDVIGPGRHTLATLNLPILTKVLSLPWGFSSPFRAEVYFVNLKVFTHLRWGTRDPVAFRDRDLGLVRLRAFGVYTMRVTQPLLLEQLRQQGAGKPEELNAIEGDIYVKIGDAFARVEPSRAATPRTSCAPGTAPARRSRSCSRRRPADPTGCARSWRRCRSCG